VPPHPIVVVAHDLRSAHNVGSIFRTADSAGLTGVVLTGFTATPDHRGVAKTALGAEEAVPWRHVADVHDALRELQAEGYTVAALERVPEAVGLGDVPDGAFPLALVLGNEVHGVPPDVLAAADLVVGIPQYGTKASLNVSVAFGVAAYGLVARVRETVGSG
jgi:tRNA G18 (ribose-2'-O)-methylase SpoU